MARFSGQCWLTGALADTTAIKLATQTAIGGVKYRFNWGDQAVAKYQC